jgi:hypothetical protein
MGTMLQRAGLEAGELPELLCITHPRADRGRASRLRRGGQRSRDDQHLRGQRP